MSSGFTYSVEVRRLHSRLCNLYRKRNVDPQQIAEAKRDHTAAKIAEWVAAQLADAPPLSAEQKARIRGLLADEPEQPERSA